MKRSSRAHASLPARLPRSTAISGADSMPFGPTWALQYAEQSWSIVTTTTIEARSEATAVMATPGNPPVTENPEVASTCTARWYASAALEPACTRMTCAEST